MVMNQKELSYRIEGRGGRDGEKEGGREDRGLFLKAESQLINVERIPGIRSATAQLSADVGGWRFDEEQDVGKILRKLSTKH